MNQWAASTLVSPSLAKVREGEVRQIQISRPPPKRWDPEAFAGEQIRNLVQQVFFSKAEIPIHHIVVSPLDQETDVYAICRSVGEELARENAGSVAVIGKFPHVSSNENSQPAGSSSGSDQTTNLREMATRTGTSLWLLPDFPPDTLASPVTLASHFADLRRDFDYSVVAAPAVANSQHAAALAQLADGIILVVAAGRTRRATAFRIKQALENTRIRILGSILSDRDFPIPEMMYRRL